MDLVIAEATWYLKKSQEIMEEGLKDPVAWRIEYERQNRIMASVFPYMCVASLAESPVLSNLNDDRGTVPDPNLFQWSIRVLF